VLEHVARWPRAAPSERLSRGASTMRSVRLPWLVVPGFDSRAVLPVRSIGTFAMLDQ